MIRTFAAVLALTSSLTASAFADAAPARPQTLHCKSPGAWGPASDFTIEELHSSIPAFPTLDASDDLRIETDGGFTTISGNNGCDNDYEMIFSVNDLKLTSQGKLQEIHGLMFYFNGQMDETVSEAITAPITCEVTKL